MPNDFAVFPFRYLFLRSSSSISDFSKTFNFSFRFIVYNLGFQKYKLPQCGYNNTQKRY